MQVLAGTGSVLQQWTARSDAAQWVGYLSSTAVYGDWQGAWVDERCGIASWPKPLDL